MAEQNTQPICGYLGATVRADRITAVDRDLTPRLAEMEAGLAAMACDPVLAAQSLVARNVGLYNLRKAGLLKQREYAVKIAGDCMGDLATEGEMLVADPAQPIASGQLALARARGDTLLRGKIYLGRLEAIAGAADIFSERPDSVFVFWHPHPAMMLAIAGQDLLAADLVVAQIDTETGTRTELPAEILTPDDRTRLASTLAFLDRSPLVLDRENAFEADHRLLMEGIHAAH